MPGTVLVLEVLGISDQEHGPVKESGTCSRSSRDSRLTWKIWSWGKNLEGWARGGHRARGIRQGIQAGHRLKPGPAANLVWGPWERRGCNPDPGVGAQEPQSDWLQQGGH